MLVQEGYTPVRLAASGPIFAGPGVVSHFFCTTPGTLEIEDGSDGLGAVAVSPFSVELGKCYPFNFAFSNGAYANLTGGAIGTFGVGQ